MKITAILANTLADRHHHRLSKEALEGLANQINGRHSMSVGVEHGRSIPPIGKVLTAFIREREDGELELVSTQELFAAPVPVSAGDDRSLWKVESATDRRPFGRFDAADRLAISVDPTNFPSKSDMSLFLKELRQEQISAEFHDEYFFRKAVLNDPELIFRLGESVVSALLAARLVGKFADRVGEKLGDEFGNLLDLMKRATVKFEASCIPKNRPVTYVLEIPGEPDVEFVAVARKPQAFTQAITGAALANSLSEARALHRRIEAIRVQFLLSDTGHWEMNYLLTGSGAVVGTRKSFRRQQKRLKVFREAPEPSGQRANYP